MNIDNGGTFTDVCISDGSRMVHAKSTTTPHDLTQCFMEVMKRGSRELFGEDDLPRLIRETDCLRYSTTSGTNAVVEHKGTPVALLVDVGSEDRFHGDTGLGASGLWRAMVPSRPSGIAVAADDSIDADELTRTVNQLLSLGAQRLAVCLRSAAAEQNVKSALLDRYPRHLLGAIPFLLSSELVNDADLTRRVTTAVINSYLHPGMEHFLYSAENVCKSRHLKRPLLIFRNDGDSARVAKTTAIKTWGSGPRGGLEGTLAYAKLYDLPTVVAMDIGGTTTDVSIVRNGKVALRPYGEVEDLSTSFPLPQLQSFGFGGSSILRVVDGRIMIGPESVGAAPGPACFGRGGTHATLTDALLVLGVLDPDGYLGGELKLDRDRALQALQVNLGDALKKTPEQAAAAVIAAFQQQIGAELAKVLAAAGADPAESTLLAFGGGGPMIVSGIAEAIGIRRVVVPRLASVFSAFGIGFSHLAHEYQMPMSEVMKNLDAVKAELAARARRDMAGEGVDPQDCVYRYSLWRAVDGAVAESPLDGAASDVDARLTLKATYELPSATLIADTARDGGGAPIRGSVTLDFGAGPSAVNVHLDSALEPGHTARGPCLLKGDYLTCLIGQGWHLRVSSNRDLVLEASKS